MGNSSAWLALALALPLAACSTDPRWTCRDLGATRECSAPLSTPPGDDWTCYAAGGDLVCSRPARAPDWPGWSCASAGAATVCRAPAAATPAEPSPDGWQARVTGRTILAAWRRAGNAPWRCDGPRCTERRPDRPSPDEWECVDGDGRVLCRGRFLEDLDPRWSCAPLGERFLCVDPDPDYPDPNDPTAWRCFYDDSLRTGRDCNPQTPTAPPPPCPGVWHDGRCLLARTRPECWLDRDCTGNRTCRIGFCVAPAAAGRRP
ncbi:MAG: hypothetical protein HY907_10940 [Deltaproteobacteria bacterium]|nr:hypothetical protein [Deltaproteobacteria bacterium]